MGLFGSILKVGGSLAGSLLGGSSSKKAAKKAAEAQAAALNNASALLRDQFGLTSGLLTPSITAGNKAIGGISDLLGLGSSTTQSQAIDNLKGSPLYQALFGNGLEALNANASATGGLRGGNLQDATMDFGRDTLAQVIQQQLSNLGGLAQLGQRSALGLGELGSSNASALANLAAGVGNVKAGAALANGAANNSLFSSLGEIGGQLGGLFDSGGLLASILKRDNVSDSRSNGGITGTLPSFLGSSTNPYNLGTIDTSPLIQRIGF
ncbi:hypothetical protein [Rhizorhabdus histidinilytica]|uniref:hypothetical protein n=1 Tax=Rhizorhabdus histidinilytica TaxID=439228 RepID=UPI00321FF5EF